MRSRSAVPPPAVWPPLSSARSTFCTLTEGTTMRPAGVSPDGDPGSVPFERGHGEARVAQLLPVELCLLLVAGPDDGLAGLVDAVGDGEAPVDVDARDEARQRVGHVVERVVVVVEDDHTPG